MASPPDPTRGALDVARRRQLARRALAGHDSGPGATSRAAARALAMVDDAAAVVLVEGISDQIAVETAAAGIGSPRTRIDMERLGFCVCVEDLEDELIRAVGLAGIEELFAAQGDLRTFRSFQSQPAWRGRDPGAQVYRFVRSSSVRNLRYARLLVTAAIARGTLPRPIEALLAAV